MFQIGYVGDDVKYILPTLFADADFAGNKMNSHSTSGIHMCMMGPNTNFPLSGISKGQTCICNSTPMAETVAAVQALRMEGIHALVLWDQILERFNKLQFMEDNTAKIRIVETGRNPTMRTIGRTHGICIRELHERFQKDDLNLRYCKTNSMAADIFAKAFECKDRWDKACQLIGMYRLEDIKTKPRDHHPISAEVAAVWYDHDKYFRTYEGVPRFLDDDMYVDAQAPTHDTPPPPAAPCVTHKKRGSRQNKFCESFQTNCSGCDKIDDAPIQDIAATCPNDQDDPSLGKVRYVTSPKGILDPSSRFEFCAQQANCVSCTGSGLADDIANAFEYGCPYAGRRADRSRSNTAQIWVCSEPGTILILSGTDPNTSAWQPTILNMMAQWNPGKPQSCVRHQPPNGQQDNQILGQTG